MAIEKLMRQIRITQEQLDFIREHVHDQVKMEGDNDQYAFLKALEDTLHTQANLPEKPADAETWIAYSSELDAAFGPFLSENEAKAFVSARLDDYDVDSVVRKLKDESEAPPNAQELDEQDETQE